MPLVIPPRLSKAIARTAAVTCFALLAGPGAIAAVMVLTKRYEDAPGMIGVLLGIVAAAAVVAIGLMLAARIARLLHPSAIQLLTRVLGLLLAAIAVQFIVDAVKIIAVR